AARTVGIDVDAADLDRRPRALELQLAFRLDTGLGSVDPFLLGAPIDVALGLIDVLASSAEAEDRAAHRFDGDIAGEDEQVRPADVFSVLALDRPQQPTRLDEIAVVRPAVQRCEELLATVG